MRYIFWVDGSTYLPKCSCCCVDLNQSYYPNQHAWNHQKLTKMIPKPSNQMVVTTLFMELLSKLTLKRMYKIPIGSAISELRGIFLFKKENHIFSMKGNMIHLDNFVIWNLFCLIPSWFILDIHPILFSNFLFFLRKENCYELCFFFGFMINLMQFFLSLMTKKVTFRMTKCENENPKQSKVILRWFITYDTI